MNRSRSWVEEEGEVFRKGTVLLGPEEMEGEYAGEELRKEVCILVDLSFIFVLTLSFSFWKRWLTAHRRALY